MTEAPTGGVRLTSLAHGGGCGCKLAPAVLQEILAKTPAAGFFPDLLVGTETGDDAAVWRLNDRQAVVATTDFFMPVVDDPFDFGRIAATNALSDIYAMGAKPIFALALVGMPVDKLSPETIGKILSGGASVCAEAGVPIAGGHSIDSVEPIYGLVALGVVDPDKLLKNSTGRAGDVLILTKALGVGVLSAAFKQEKLDDAGYAALIASTTKLNTVGAELPDTPGVHAVTDVTGVRLAGSRVGDVPRFGIGRRDRRGCAGAARRRRSARPRRRAHRRLRPQLGELRRVGARRRPGRLAPRPAVRPADQRRVADRGRSGRGGGGAGLGESSRVRCGARRGSNDQRGVGNPSDLGRAAAPFPPAHPGECRDPDRMALRPTKFPVIPGLSRDPRRCSAPSGWIRRFAAVAPLHSPSSAFDTDSRHRRALTDKSGECGAL